MWAPVSNTLDSLVDLAQKVADLESGEVGLKSQQQAELMDFEYIGHGSRAKTLEQSFEVANEALAAATVAKELLMKTRMLRVVGIQK